ncbi:hypothetical protein Dimus_018028 [Dionaea muscipula]
MAAMMNLGSPLLSRLPFSPPPTPHISRFSFSAFRSNKSTLMHLLLGVEACASASFIRFSSRDCCCCCLGARSSVNESGNYVAEEEDFSLDDELISRVSSAKDASEVLGMVAETSRRSGGVLCASDCCRIIAAAIKRNKFDLAMSIFNAMRSSFDQDFLENGAPMERWKWSRPDVSTFTSLVLGLSASLRVSDAVEVITAICGLSPREEVSFGKIVKCPACMIAVAVAQPQHGIQIVSCSKCRYQYELISGDIIDLSSEEIRLA